jgi:hypothetical protein
MVIRKRIRRNAGKATEFLAILLVTEAQEHLFYRFCAYKAETI